jgi:hypothetical protein
MKTIEFQFLKKKKERFISVLVTNINGTGNPISGPAQKKFSSISSSENQTLFLSSSY